MSDGLFQDLNHVLSFSNLTSIIYDKNIPISSKLKAYLKKYKKNKLNFISNGDDYQILFTANSNKRKLINQISKQTSTKVTKIGIVKRKSFSNKIILKNNKLICPKKLGYLHDFA